MRLLILMSMAACLLPASLPAATEQQKINLRYRSVADATEEVAKEFGAEGTAAILTTDRKRNTVTLRPDAPFTARVRAFLASIDHKRETVKIGMIVTRKMKGKPEEAAQEVTLARPIMFGSPGKPMIVSFDKDGETFQIEVNAEIVKP